ncbi:MAG: LD-carboxypeptidase [Acidobacteriota bacterium]
MLKRRDFLASLSLPLLAGVSRSETTPAPLLRGRRLKPGDTVGLISPATPVSDPDLLQKAERTINYFGWKVNWGRSVGKKSGYFGSSVAERVTDLHEMFADPAVDAVFAIRGGYGSSQILDQIDYELIRKNPKIFVGYSDITAMHLAIYQKTRLVTFHSPVPLSPFTKYTQRHFLRAITEAVPNGVVTNPVESNELRPQHPLRTIVPGKATGPLVGGNLTLISTLMGTPYEIDTRGAIFFIEDVGEEPYRIDRMLTQLRLAGKFDQAAGVIFGECSDCTPSDFRPFVAAGFSLGEVVDAILGPLKIPVLAGMTIGHTAEQLTLPLGIRATLDAKAGTLDLRESAVR